MGFTQEGIWAWGIAPSKCLYFCEKGGRRTRCQGCSPNNRLESETSTMLSPAPAVESWMMFKARVLGSIMRESASGGSKLL